MYSPNAPLPKAIAITAEKASPPVTQTIDSTRACLGEGACASRCLNRSMASMTRITRRSAIHAPAGTSRSTSVERSVPVAAIINGRSFRLSQERDRRRSRSRIEKRSGGRAVDCRTDDLPHGATPLRPAGVCRNGNRVTRRDCPAARGPATQGSWALSRLGDRSPRHSGMPTVEQTVFDDHRRQGGVAGQAADRFDADRPALQVHHPRPVSDGLPGDGEGQMGPPPVVGVSAVEVTAADLHQRIGPALLGAAGVLGSRAAGSTGNPARPGRHCRLPGPGRLPGGPCPTRTVTPEEPVERTPGRCRLLLPRGRCGAAIPPTPPAGGGKTPTPPGRPAGTRRGRTAPGPAPAPRPVAAPAARTPHRRRRRPGSPASPARRWPLPGGCGTPPPDPPTRPSARLWSNRTPPGGPLPAGPLRR